MLLLSLVGGVTLQYALRQATAGHSIRHSRGLAHALDDRGGRGHLELVYNIQGFLDVESKRLETGMDVDFTLLSNHVLRNDIEVSERLVHEGGYITGSLQDFSILVGVDKVEQLIEDLLDIGNLVQVSDDERALGLELLLFAVEPLQVLVLNLLLFVFQLLLEVHESLVNVVHLLGLQPLEFLLYLLEQLAVLVVKSLSIDDHLLQIQDVLLQA
mmetsp:Transcript_33047/g.50660  ORF Transcript_33047/g.50660 Transcript_33047/m.50660 type:complete len:214 (-) Transcript_33047:412-1053(-)